MKLTRNKLTALLLALAMLLALTGSASAAYLGDINRDGKVNSTDARTALRAAAKLETLTDEQTRFGDVNGNGHIDASDARIILRMAANLEALVEFDETGTETPTVTTTEPTAPPTTNAPTTNVPTTGIPGTTSNYLYIEDKVAGLDDWSYVPFSCGHPNHHCDQLSTHQTVLEMERNGCRYCGAHDCPSFYVTQNGITTPDPTKCPKYDIHKDPTEYCQTCGKPLGDGYNGTCCHFIRSKNCPDCGKWVEAFACHSH